MGSSEGPGDKTLEERDRGHFPYETWCKLLWPFLCRLGGPDPLDFISMFNNPGSPMEGIPSHWHYISAGLSDLHGDGRVHEYVW